jgi:predicted alpha-1,2-mannosidase
MLAFGARGFDARAALGSLVRAATLSTPDDRSKLGCPVECPGQRPSLDDVLRLHYVPKDANAWGGAGETLEDASADFAIGEMAGRLGDEATRAAFRERSGWWRNVFNPGTRYVQDRNADGSWPASDPASEDGFAEGSSAQYTWMVPFDMGGLAAALGGADATNARLDAFFHAPDGSFTLTASGGRHAELDNEPSIATPFAYLYTGRPDAAQATVRAAVNRLWSDAPYGIPGNDDLGEMSSWYVFAALGLYPAAPGRAELLIASPLFPQAELHRANGPVITIRAERAAADAPYVTGLRVDGQPSSRPWLPESFVLKGGSLDFDLSQAPDRTWGSRPEDAPPSFGPDAGR